MVTMWSSIIEINKLTKTTPAAAEATATHTMRVGERLQSWGEGILDRSSLEADMLRSLCE